MTQRMGWRAGEKDTGVALWVTIIAGAVFTGLGFVFGIPASTAMASPLSPDTQSAEFSICGNSRRVNCVVDGDTFWFHAKKIRIADIDAPELSPPRCDVEHAKGEAAKQRLLALLNSGKFSITATGRDQDRFGRDLRIITRHGRSIGTVLVEENLARRWNGGRRPWCN